ncbi:HAD-IA family hydrolase [Rhodococcus sp. H29-C3]|uniref:HAD family hydrolase n=1 Tax=Rhodococcus sp. H29-C3 TaxID=3046307 RepID=UPI0024B91FC0|nr:HAD-IA family hydrolase [Rhodococcus sp. H29-C3]MDJ0363379.1 HAD-IA family hydrolase [Rhodococcus sp. H29-C3]
MRTSTAPIELRKRSFVVSTANYHTVAKAVIFDLDGVLVDSHPQIDQALRQWARSRNVDLTRWWQEAHALTDPEFIALAAPHLDVDRETQALRVLEYELAGTARPYDGAQQSYGSMPTEVTCIVTSGSRATVLRRIRAAGLPEPSILIAAEDVRRGKPHPEPYLTALEEMNISAGEAIVIEDSPAGVRSACSAGIPVIGIARTPAAARELADENLVDRLPGLTSLSITEHSHTGP